MLEPARAGPLSWNEKKSPASAITPLNEAFSGCVIGVAMPRAGASSSSRVSSWSAARIATSYGPTVAVSKLVTASVYLWPAINGSVSWLEESLGETSSAEASRTPVVVS